MSDLFDLRWLLLGVVPVFILLGLAINLKRARKWAAKARSHGAVHCRTCGFVGEPGVGTVSASDPRSSNLRLMCASCHSPDWYVPDNEQAS
jgi:hypothetical protein